jgi:hypothetical protein
VIFRTGFRHMFNWYQTELTRFGLTSPKQADFVQHLIRTHIQTWDYDTLCKADPYAVLLAAYLHAGHRGFTSRDLLLIATSSIRIDEELIIQALQNLWYSALAHQQNSPPWRVLDLSNDATGYSPPSRRTFFEIQTTKDDHLELPLASYQLAFRLLKDATSFGAGQPRSKQFI